MAITVTTSPDTRVAAWYKTGVQLACTSDRTEADLQIRCKVFIEDPGGGRPTLIGTQQKSIFEFDISAELRSILSWNLKTGTTGLYDGGQATAFQYRVQLIEIYTDNGLITTGDNTEITSKFVYNSAKQFTEDGTVDDFIMSAVDDTRFLTNSPSTIKSNGTVQLGFLSSVECKLAYQRVYPSSGIVQYSSTITPQYYRGIALFKEGAAGESYNVWIADTSDRIISEIKKVDIVDKCEIKEFAFVNSLGDIDHFIWQPEYVESYPIKRDNYKAPITGTTISEQGTRVNRIEAYKRLSMGGALTDNERVWVLDMLTSPRVWYVLNGNYLIIDPKSDTYDIYNSKALNDFEMVFDLGHDLEVLA